jgi:hypothetical protein
LLVELLSRRPAQLLKTEDLSATQYNPFRNPIVYPNLRLDLVVYGYSVGRFMPMHGTDYLVIVAGDLNMDASKAAVALQLAKAKFQDAVVSPRASTTPARGLLERGARIDWAFIPGEYGRVPAKAAPLR